MGRDDARPDIRYSEVHGGWMLYSGRRVQAGPFVTRALALEFVDTALICVDCGNRVEHDTEAESWLKTTVLYDPEACDVDCTGRTCPVTDEEHRLTDDEARDYDACEWQQMGVHGTETCGEYKDEQADDRLPYCTRHRGIAISEEA